MNDEQTRTPAGKLTPWFPPTIKPARIGVYERDMPNFGGRYSFWNGECWCGWGDTIGIALHNGEQGLVSNIQSVKWRGLSEKPNDDA